FFHVLNLELEIRRQFVWDATDRAHSVRLYVRPNPVRAVGSALAGLARGAAAWAAAAFGADRLADLWASRARWARRRGVARPDLVRVLHPADHEGVVELGADPAQRRADGRDAGDLGQVLVALGQVAAVAAELLEEMLAARDLLRAVQVLHPGVALDAVRLH